MAAIGALLQTALGPVTDLVDKLHTSQEERGALRLQLLEAQLTLAQKLLENEVQLAESKAKVITAEATGQSWLQRNWRPLLMVTFGMIVAWNYIVVDLLTWVLALVGVQSLPPRLEVPEGMWTLLTIGIGGYIAGRSAEKVVTTLAMRGLSFGKNDEQQ